MQPFCAVLTWLLVGLPTMAALADEPNDTSGAAPILPLQPPGGTDVVAPGGNDCAVACADGAAIVCRADCMPDDLRILDDAETRAVFDECTEHCHESENACLAACAAP